MLSESLCFRAEHLGMTQDIPFLQRADYMQNGVMKYEVFCPLTEGAKKKVGKGWVQKGYYR